MAAAAVQEFGSNDYAAEKIKELKLLYEGIKAQNVEAKAQIENLQLEVAGTIATNIIMVEKHSKLEKLYHTAKEDTKQLLLVKQKQDRRIKILGKRNDDLVAISRKLKEKELLLNDQISTHVARIQELEAKNTAKLSTLLQREKEIAELRKKYAKIKD